MPCRPPLPALLLLVAALATPAFAPAAAGGPSEPERHEYVVVLSPGTEDVDAVAAELLAPWGATPRFVYTHALAGFSVHLDAAGAAGLAAAPGVELVERSRLFAPASTAVPVPTGLSRIGGAPLVGTATRVDVDVAVLDTGVDADHPDLRVHHRADCTRPVTERSRPLIPFVTTSSSREREVCAPDRGDDDSGHGTHVAGVIGAKDDGRGVVGVAPGARIWSVKVLDVEHGGGSTGQVVAGIDHATERASQLEVVNLSFVADGRSRATDRAIAGARRAGLVVVAAAGNDAAPASSYSPANSPGVITVSAVTDLDGAPGGRAAGSCRGGDDQFATYSNYGPAVTIAAPGSCVLSTAVGGGTASYSGTSVAAPHVAGAAARHIARTREPRRAARWERTRDALLAAAARQDGPCGFTGGRSAEPLLRLTGC